MTLACLAGKISHFQHKITFFKLGDQTVVANSNEVRTYTFNAWHTEKLGGGGGGGGGGG